MLEFEEHKSENDMHTFRLIEHDCGDPTCDACSKGDEEPVKVCLFNSVKYNQHRWICAGAVDEKLEEAFLETFKHEQYADMYAKLAAIFGVSWDVFEKDIHMGIELSKDRLKEVTQSNKFMDALSKVEAKYVTLFAVPETAKSKNALDRVKTLLAFPQLYKPKKKSKKK